MFNGGVFLGGLGARHHDHISSRTSGTPSLRWKRASPGETHDTCRTCSLEGVDVVVSFPPNGARLGHWGMVWLCRSWTTSASSTLLGTMRQRQSSRVRLTRNRDKEAEGGGVEGWEEAVDEEGGGVGEIQQGAGEFFLHTKSYTKIEI